MADFLETHGQILEAQAIEAHIKKQDEYMQKRVDEFLLQNVERVKEWMKTHPNERLPVYYLAQGDTVVWLNRDQRRKQRQHETKEKKIAQRKAALALSSHSKAAFKSSHNPTQSNNKPAKEPNHESTTTGIERSSSEPQEHCNNQHGV